MSVQSWLNGIWYERASPPWWLLPLSLTYGAVSGSRRFLYSHHLRRATRMPCPVVVVGNLSVGGTGKTPLVCWLVAHLAERGYTPGVVTRGYGGSSRDVRRISASDDPNVVGDESVLLARRTGRHWARPPGCSAAVGERRVQCHRERRWPATLCFGARLRGGGDRRRPPLRQRLAAPRWSSAGGAGPPQRRGCDRRERRTGAPSRRTQHAARSQECRGIAQRSGAAAARFCR